MQQGGDNIGAPFHATAVGVDAFVCLLFQAEALQKMPGTVCNGRTVEAIEAAYVGEVFHCRKIAEKGDLLWYHAYNMPDACHVVHTVFAGNFSRATIWLYKTAEDAYGSGFACTVRPQQ